MDSEVIEISTAAATNKMQRTLFTGYYSVRLASWEVFVTIFRDDFRLGSRTQSNRLLTPYWRYERLRQPLLVATVRTCTKRSKSLEALTID